MTEILEMFKYLTGTLEKEEKRVCRIYTICSCVSPVVDIISYSIIIYIINLVSHRNQISSDIIIFTFLMGTVSVLKAVFELYRHKISNRFLYKGAQNLSAKIYEVLIKEDLSHHNQKSGAQALEMVYNDAANSVYIITGCIEICTNFITMTGYAIVLIYALKWFGLVSSIVLLLCIMKLFFMYRKQMKTYGEKCRMSKIKMASQITIAYGVFKEMKLDKRAALIQKKYEDISEEYAYLQSEYNYKNSRIRILIQNSVMVAMYFALGLLFLAGNKWSFLFELMAVYIMALVKMLPMAYGIIREMNHIEFSRKSYEVLREGLARYTEIKKEERKTNEVREKAITLQRGVFVKNLTFGYREGVFVFENASVDIPAGYAVAITGVSGAGKTTFLDLLLGLLKPQSGSILYDDYDIVTETDNEGVCKANIGEVISYIPQTVYLNGETIRNNVAFFEDEKNIDDAKIQESLECAQIWEDILKMPDGVHTLIGENGTVISGGQRQRIALARALYKDFELLIMDEATAALDEEMEKAVVDSIRKIKKNKTILMVTHHTGLANECDIIYKIENQKIKRVR